MHDTSPKPERPDPGYSQEDWDEVSDNPELTDADLAEMRPAREVPEVYNLLPKRGRGRPKLADAKVNLTLRIDPALLDAYRATGTGWQVLMHEALAAGRPEMDEAEAIDQAARRTAKQKAADARAASSGSYEVVGPRGGRTALERTVLRGEPLPPTGEAPSGRAARGAGKKSA